MHIHIITTHTASLTKKPASIKDFIRPTICGGIHRAPIGFLTIIDIQGWGLTIGLMQAVAATSSDSPYLLQFITASQGLNTVF
jgi:hypothetical protein